MSSLTLPRWMPPGSGLMQMGGRAALLVSVLCLAACAAKPPPPVVTTVSLSVTAGADANPDARKRASPVNVRVYALKSAAPFESADFFSLYEKDVATLGADLVQREEFLLRPGEVKAMELKLGPEAKTLAVMAAFRDLEHARWRQVHTLDIGKPVEVNVSLKGSQLGLAHKLLPPPPEKK